MSIITSQLPLARAGHQSLYSNGSLFVIGGQDGSNNLLSDIQSAKVNPDGTIGLWAPITGNLGIHTQGAMVIANGLVIISGGLSQVSPSNVYSNDLVIYALDTQLGLRFVQRLLMPVPCARHGMVVVGNYLYVLGGDTATNTQTAQIWKVLIDSTGIVGQWTQEAPLPQAMSGFTCLAVSNCIYTIGGISGTYDMNSWQGNVSTQGSITSWQAFADTGLIRTDYASANLPFGFAAASGHTAANTALSDVQLVTLSPSGGFNGTKTVAMLPASLNNASAATDGVNLYVTGGFVAGVAQSNAYTVSIDLGYSDPDTTSE